MFSVKREGLVNRDVFFEKGRGITYFYTNYPFSVLSSLSLRFACVCF